MINMSVIKICNMSEYAFTHSYIDDNVLCQFKQRNLNNENKLRPCKIKCNNDRDILNSILCKSCCIFH